MTHYTQKLRQHVVGVALLSLVLTPSVSAGKLKIFNDNQADIIVTIVPEVDSRNEYAPPSCWKCIEGVCKNAPHKQEIIISSADLCGKQYFKVRASKGGIFSNKQCDHLNVSKNYEIHFRDDKGEKGCFSKEI